MLYFRAPHSEKLVSEACMRSQTVAQLSQAEIIAHLCLDAKKIINNAWLIGVLCLPVASDAKSGSPSVPVGTTHIKLNPNIGQHQCPVYCVGLDSYTLLQIKRIYPYSICHLLCHRWLCHHQANDNKQKYVYL